MQHLSHDHAITLHSLTLTLHWLRQGCKTGALGKRANARLCHMALEELENVVSEKAFLIGLDRQDSSDLKNRLSGIEHLLSQIAKRSEPIKPLTITVSGGHNGRLSASLKEGG